MVRNIIGIVKLAFENIGSEVHQNRAGEINAINDRLVFRDLARKPLRIGEKEVKYDSEGRLVQIEGTNVKYDPSGRIIEILGQEIVYGRKGNIESVGETYTGTSLETSFGNHYIAKTNF
jgi:hypothetical protein